MAVATSNVHTLFVNGKDGHGHAECVLAKVRQLGCDFIGLQETRRSGKTELPAAGYRIVCSPQEETEGRQ